MTSTKGLEGVVATQSAISSIIDDTLTYVGYDIDDLATNASFEEVIYLLWHQRLPKEDELSVLKQQLADNMSVPQEVLNHFTTYPNGEVHPMAALRTAISLLGLYDAKAEDMSDEANYEKAIKLQAKIATLVTSFSRIRKGLEPVAPKAEFGYAENF